MTTIVGKDAPLEQSIAHFQEILKNLKKGFKKPFLVYNKRKGKSIRNEK